jgi:hypothetical protein
LERVEGIAPESRGSCQRKEFEYIRHGTTGLMAAVNVATGNITNHRLHPTRNEEDFLAFIETTVAQFPEQDEIIIMVDPLNTHQ